MQDEKQVLDIEEQKAITRAVALMLQKCPAVTNRKITTRIEDLMTTPGVIGIFPLNGSVYLKKYISGAFVGQCSFMLKYRHTPTDDEDKIDAADTLDRAGQWMEGRKVTIDGKEYELSEYPELTDGREIVSIERQSNAFLNALMQDGSADYQINLRVQYRKS